MLIISSLYVSAYAATPTAICIGEDNSPAYNSKVTYTGNWTVTQGTQASYPTAVTVSSELNTIGYSSSPIQNCDASYLCNALGNNAIFYSYTHSSAGEITHSWKDSSNNWQVGLIGATNGDISLSSVYSTSTSKLKSLRLAYFQGCDTANTSDTFGNLLTQSVSLGADAAIGFSTETLQGIADYYDSRFFSYANDASTPLYSACQSALIDTYNAYGNDGGTESYIIEGNESETLKPAANGIN